MRIYFESELMSNMPLNSFKVDAGIQGLCSIRAAGHVPEEVRLRGYPAFTSKFTCKQGTSFVYHLFLIIRLSFHGIDKFEVLFRSV